MDDFYNDDYQGNEARSVSEKIQQDKLKVISDFYGIETKDLMFYDKFSEECFLGQGQFLLGSLDAYKLLYNDNDIIKATNFSHAISMKNTDVFADAVDRLFVHVKKFYDDGMTPTKPYQLAYFSLLEGFSPHDAHLAMDMPITHLKFQIISMVCLGVKTSILNIISKERISDIQVSLLFHLIALYPHLEQQRNALERESGINRATIHRLMPVVKERLKIWEEKADNRNKFYKALGKTKEESLKRHISVIRQQLWHLSQIKEGA